MSMATESIPHELRALKQWVCWRYEQRGDGAKPTKVPVTIGGYKASSTGPADWYSFDDVVEAAPKFAGIGFVFSPEDPYLGIDLDNCLGEGGEIAPWAAPILERFADSYAEVSPSGRGVKIICRGRNPMERGRKVAIEDGGIEVYDRGRFFTITGNVWDADPPAEKQDAIAWLATEFFPPEPERHSAAIPADQAGDVCKRAAAYLETMDPAVAGAGGHNTTFRAACAMVLGFGLTADQAYALMWSSYNPRCVPPWNAKEIRHKVDQAEKQPGERGYLLTEKSSRKWEERPGVDLSGILGGAGGPGGGEDDRPDSSPAVLSVANLIANYPERREPIVDGLFRRGETCNIIGAPKAGKSWFLYGLALSVATGRDWLGMPTTEGRVLLIDNEIHPPELASRFDAVARAMAIPAEVLADRVDVLPLRGRLLDLGRIASLLDGLCERRYALVALDAFYRCLPAGMSENDNAAMAAVYNRLDQVAAEMNAAIVLNHHASKGDQTTKSITDVGSGAGSISRAADCHLILRPHELEDCAVLDAACRSFPPVAASTIAWDWPLWAAKPGIEPELRTHKPEGRIQQERTDRETDDAILAAIEPAKRLTRYEIRKATGFGAQRVDRAIARLGLAGRVMVRNLRKRGTDTRKEVIEVAGGSS